MNDPQDDFELELKARLAVDPSSNLQDRIRARAFAPPERQTPWFALTAGLATVAMVITFLVIHIQRQSPERNIPFSGPVAAEPVNAPSREPLPSRAAATAQPASFPKMKPLMIAVEGAEPSTTLAPAAIELAPLRVLELAGSLAPIPQVTVPAVARIQPIQLEPLALAVQNQGVNE